MTLTLKAGPHSSYTTTKNFRKESTMFQRDPWTTNDRFLHVPRGTYLLSRFSFASYPVMNMRPRLTHTTLVFNASGISKDEIRITPFSAHI
jgi:hypothetical protein